MKDIIEIFVSFFWVVNSAENVMYYKPQLYNITQYFYKIYRNLYHFELEVCHLTKLQEASWKNITPYDDYLNSCTTSTLNASAFKNYDFKTQKLCLEGILALPLIHASPNNVKCVLLRGCKDKHKFTVH